MYKRQVIIYDNFKNGELQDPLSEVSGVIDHKGFHTIELPEIVHLKSGDDFYVYLNLSDGGQPYDCTSEIPVLLGGVNGGTVVRSLSHPGESFYRDSTGKWADLYEDDNSANFCIKALVPKRTDLYCEGGIHLTNVKPGSIVQFNISVANKGESFSKLDWKIDNYPDWGKWEFHPSSGDDLLPESSPVNITVTLTVPNDHRKEFSGEITISNRWNESDFEKIPIQISTSKNRNYTINMLSYIYQHVYLPVEKLLSRLTSLQFRG